MKPMESRRAELYQHIAAIVADAAQTLGLDSSTAEHIGCSIVDTLAEDFGGQVISFPKDEGYRLAAREREILELHRMGAAIPELCRKYGMTERGLRKLLKRASLRDRNLNQIELFESFQYP